MKVAIYGAGKYGKALFNAMSEKKGGDDRRVLY